MNFRSFLPALPFISPAFDKYTEKCCEVRFLCKELGKSEYDYTLPPSMLLWPGIEIDDFTNALILKTN